MLVYGKNVAQEILQFHPKSVRKIFIQEGIQDEKIISFAEKEKIHVQFKRKQEMDRLANGLHQGIILDVADYQYSSLEEVLLKDPSFFVILDHLEDPHNLGAIIRTCEAAGVDAIILPQDRQVLVNATVMKTSAGSLVRMKLVKVTNLSQTIRILQDQGFWVVGTDMEGQDFRTIDYQGKIALVIGNEGKGMSSLVKKSCDFVASIPMYGEVNSLNASVASGIMIYEVIRNRK